MTVDQHCPTTLDPAYDLTAAARTMAGRDLDPHPDDAPTIRDLEQTTIGMAERYADWIATGRYDYLAPDTHSHRAQDACGRCQVPRDLGRTCTQADRSDGGCPDCGACMDCVSLAAQCAEPVGPVIGYVHTTPDGVQTRLLPGEITIVRAAPSTMES